jgi:XRE family aerobic/anaerobic benzoate catabolism transcriptional regulator
MSRRLLSERSGVSERFLAQLEAGKGNISLRRLADVTSALEISPGALLERATADCRSRGVIALLGVRGAGKSSIGKRLAERFGLPFIEVDSRIENIAGLTLGEIFALHGESYYRRLEREVLSELLRDPAPMILATGGSIVTDESNYALLRENAYTIWLQATAEDHWNRVVKQGDARPMAENPHAFAELRALLSARSPLYGKAHHAEDTSGRSIDEVVEHVANAVQDVL